MSVAPTATTDVDRCPACESPRRRFLYCSGDWVHGVPGSFRLVRCESCDSVYPQPRPSPDTLRTYYPEGDYYAYTPHPRHKLWVRRGRLAHVWYSTKRGTLRRHGYAHHGGSALLAATVGRLPVARHETTFSLGILLHPWVEGASLLDVGCGNGRYLDLMRALGWSRVVGVDTSASAVRAAREQLGIEAHCGDVRDVGLPDGSFHAVSISHTLEHVDDPAAVLAEIRRATKPGGRIAIVVPNVRSLLSRTLRESWLHLDTPRHLVVFSPRGLRSAVERAGLQLESLTTSPRGAYGVALLSMIRAAGEPHPGFKDPPRFGLRRRLAARTLAGLERALCAARASVGEELFAVARAPGP